MRTNAGREAQPHPSDLIGSGTQTGMDKRLHILHLEDEPDFAELVRSVFLEDKLDVEVKCVGDRASFEQQLEAETFDLILSDFKTWCDAKLAERAAIQKRIKEESTPAGLDCDDRLSAIESYIQGIKGDGPKDLDWEAMIKRYAVLNYVDYSYRCIQEEISYQAPLRRRTQ